MQGLERGASAIEPDGRRKCMEYRHQTQYLLQRKKETARAMRGALDIIVNSMDSRFEQIMYLHDAFGFLLQMKTLMTMSDDEDQSASDLQTKCIHFAKVYLDDGDGYRFAEEIKDCRVPIVICRRTAPN